MASENEFVYKLDVDVSGLSVETVAKSLASLKTNILQTEAEISKLKAGIKAGTISLTEAAGPLSQHEAKLKGLRNAYHEASRSALGLQGFTQKINAAFKESLGPIQGLLGQLGPLGGRMNDLVGKVGAINSVLGVLTKTSQSTSTGVDSLNKFVGSVEGSATKASKGIGGLLAGLNPVAVVAAVAGAAILQFGGELLKTAEHVELVERKAKLLYGDAFPELDAAARANANAIGLTRVEYLELAASQQQVFDALGLTKAQTADLTPRLLELADGLADFSGGQLDTAGAADILRKAIQGNTKGLAEFGIPIKRSKEELQQLSAELLATGQYTQDQADALAAVEIVFEKVGDTIEEFGAGQETLADKTDRINAKFREQKEELANALTPAFNAVTEAAGGFIETLSKAFEGDFDGFQLAAAQFVAITSGNEKGAEAIGKMIAAREKSNASAEEEARSIKNVVNAQSVAAASTDQLNEKLAERRHLISEFARLNKQAVADKAGFGAEVALIEAEIAKRKEQQDAAAKTGLSYEALQAQLTSLQETRKGIGELETEALKQNEKEIAAIQKRLKAFDVETEKVSELEKANKKFADSQVEIALVYGFATAKIQEAAKAGLVSQQAAQQQLLELEVAVAQQRLQAAEEFAKADRKITEEEQANIIALSNQLLVAKNAVTEYGKALDKELKDREAAVKIRVELEQADIGARINKEVADAIAAGELATALDKVFSTATTELGKDLHEQIKQAALAGEPLDLELLKDGGATKKEIEAIQAAYDKFRLETERNRVQLIRDEDKRKAEDLREELDKLIERRQQLLSKQSAASTDISIKFSEEDLAELDSATAQINDLEGKTVEAEVKVAVDDKELKKLEEGIDKIVDGASKKKTAKKGFESPLAVALGLDETGIQGLYDLARDVSTTISNLVLSAQEQRIAQTLAAQQSGLEQQYDHELQALKDRLDAGLITETEYDRQSEDLQIQTERRKREVEKQAFEERKRINKAQAAVELGVELARIAATAAEAGFAAPAVYAVYAGLAFANYATNLALIESAVFARKGTIVKAQQGQVAQGPSHEQGGILGMVDGKPAVELEGGEVIVNRRSSEAFREELSAINSYQGWGVPFAASGMKIPEKKQKHPGMSLLNWAAPTVTSSLERFAYGGITMTALPRFEYGGKLPQVFSSGGQVSLIPSDDVIANRRQLEESAKRISHRVVKLNNEPSEQMMFLPITELERKMANRKRSNGRVQFGG